LAVLPGVLGDEPDGACSGVGETHLEPERTEGLERLVAEHASGEHLRPLTGRRAGAARLLTWRRDRVTVPLEPLDAHQFVRPRAAAVVEVAAAAPAPFHRLVFRAGDGVLAHREALSPERRGVT